MLIQSVAIIILVHSLNCQIHIFLLVYTDLKPFTQPVQNVLVFKTDQ